MKECRKERREIFSLCGRTGSDGVMDPQFGKLIHMRQVIES
jgi:hypothetical protein